MTAPMTVTHIRAFLALVINIVIVAEAHVWRGVGVINSHLLIVSKNVHQTLKLILDKNQCKLCVIEPFHTLNCQQIKPTCCL